jgi:hypothetical protein
VPSSAGADVRLIPDTTFYGRASGIGALADAGVPIWIDDRPRIAHAKTMVIDGAVTLKGSYNWGGGCSAELRRPEPRLLPDGRRRLRGPLARAPRRLRPVRSARGLVLELMRWLARLFWETADRVDYAVSLARCSVVDVIYGPEPPTAADERREAEHEKAFPRVHKRSGPGAERSGVSLKPKVRVERA